MKDILMIAHFTQIPGEAGNGRFKYILENSNIQNVSMELVTTSFSHRVKKQRFVSEEQRKKLTYKLTMLEEPGYSQNVSLQRFYSHYKFGTELRKYLDNRERPDVIYCSVPSLNAAKVAAEYASENKIRFIIDIQDLWPEAFKMVFNYPFISDLMFRPMRKAADYIYSKADSIIAVSETYSERALEVNKRCNEALTVFLGTELKQFDHLALERKFENKPDDEIWIAYIGTLGHSYDLICVIDALKILKNAGNKKIKFVVMGDGPLRDNFENYANEQGIFSEFTGRLEYEEMVRILIECDIAVNPIKPGSAGSIINKVGDYAAAGLPVLNTQESKEYRDIIDKYEIGLNCENNDPKDLSEKILFLCQNSNLRKKLGANNRRIAEMKFDREVTYKEIYNLISND